MRYIILPPDPTLAQIDEALTILRIRRKATPMALIRGWIDDDIDELLDMRTERTYLDEAAALLKA